MKCLLQDEVIDRGIVHPVIRDCFLASVDTHDLQGLHAVSRVDPLGMSFELPTFLSEPQLSSRLRRSSHTIDLTLLVCMVLKVSTRTLPPFFGMLHMAIVRCVRNESQVSGHSFTSWWSPLTSFPAVATRRSRLLGIMQRALIPCPLCGVSRKTVRGSSRMRPSFCLWAIGERSARNEREERLLTILPTSRSVTGIVTSCLSGPSAILGFVVPLVL